MWKLPHKKGLKCRVTLQGILEDCYLLNCLLNVCILLNFCVEDMRDREEYLPFGQVTEDLRQPQHY